MEKELLEIKQKYEKYKSRAEVIGILVLSLIFLSIGVFWYFHNNVKEAYEREADSSLGTIQTYKLKINADSSTMYSQQTLIGEKDDLIIHAKDEAKHYKDLYFSLNTKIGAQVNNIGAKIIRDTVVRFVSNNEACDSAIAEINQYIADETIPVGSAIIKNTKWYNFNSILRADSLQILSMGFKSGDVSVIVGKEKNKWFQDKKLFQRGQETTTMKVESPHFYVEDMSSIKLDDKRKKPILLSRTAMFLYGMIVSTAVGTVLILQ